MNDRTTKSETNTRAFFSSINIELRRISVSKKHREQRPDYSFMVNDAYIYVEVKQLEENDQEKEVASSINVGKFIAYDQSNCSQRIREKIEKANDQLSKLCVNSNPGVLILQDVRPFYTRSFWIGHSVQEAMFGVRQTWRTVPTHRNGYQSEMVADVFGPTGRTTRSDKNQHVSCIGVLPADEDPSRSKLAIYHNPYALFPLLKTDISSPRVSHFRREEPYGNYENWTQF